MTTKDIQISQKPSIDLKHVFFWFFLFLIVSFLDMQLLLTL